MRTNRWVGGFIIAVGPIHCVVGALIFMTPLMEILNHDVWNAVTGLKEGRSHSGSSLSLADCRVWKRD